MKIQSVMIAIVMSLSVGCLDARSEEPTQSADPQEQAAPTPPPSGQLVCGTQSCSLPSQQCNYADWASTTGTCAAFGSSPGNYGTEQCDGPEDCTAGQKCFAHTAYHEDPYGGIDTLTWTSNCRTTPIDPSLLGDGRPHDEILCHPGANTCPSGRACVPSHSTPTFYGFELPQQLYVCY